MRHCSVRRLELLREAVPAESPLSPSTVPELPRPHRDGSEPAAEFLSYRICELAAPPATEPLAACWELRGGNRSGYSRVSDGAGV